MCDLCDRIKMAEFEATQDSLCGCDPEPWLTERLSENRIDAGVFGEFILELNFVMEYGKNYLESCVSLNNDIDMGDLSRIEIKYCPFCGREL